MGILQWIDKNKRLFGMVHWVDLLVIIASLLVIGKVVLSFWPDSTAREATPIEITVVSTNLRPEVVEGIRPGEWVKDARTGANLGTVTEKKAVPHVASHWDGSRLVKTTDDQRLDLQLTLKQKAVFKRDEGIFLGAMALRAGRTGTFCTIDAEFYGEVIRVAKTRTDLQE